MKNIYDCLSPSGWICLIVASYVPVWIIFRPSWVEFLVLLLADTVIVAQINSLVERRIFTKLFPDTKSYFPVFNSLLLERSTLPEKISFVESLMAFPLRQAKFCFLWGMVKVIPGVLIVTFYWQHEISYLRQAVLVSLICLINLAYFYGCVYIQSHIYISQMLENLHLKFNLSTAFEKVRIHYSRKEALIQEVLSLISLTFFVVILQWSIAHFEAGSPDLALKIMSVALIGLFLFSYTWYLARNFNIQALEGLFKTMKTLDYRAKPKPLALHSSPLLAEFDRTFNLLVGRLSKTEHELSALISSESEKSRYRALGEISALIAHDLSAPLHAINFCVDSLKENPSKISDPRYLEHLETSVRQSLDLINSLRAKLKNSPEQSKLALFSEAHKHVVKLLSIQYGSRDFGKVQFVVKPLAHDLKLKISQVDLIHVLDNLYRNSIENLLLNSISSPRIEVSFLKVGGDVDLYLRDNGTGLTKEAFLYYTDATNFAHVSLGQVGLGLRLTKRLVERSGGSLEIIENFGGLTGGTTFQLKLPLGLEDLHLSENDEKEVDYV